MNFGDVNALASAEGCGVLRLTVNHVKSVGCQWVVILVRRDEMSINGKALDAHVLAKIESIQIDDHDRLVNVLLWSGCICFADFAHSQFHVPVQVAEECVVVAADANSTQVITSKLEDDDRSAVLVMPVNDERVRALELGEVFVED